MEALVLCEIAAGREELREALLARIGRLGLNGRAKLSFVARERNAPGNMLLAVGFPDAAGAERFAAEAVGDGLAPAEVRLLALDATWQVEPLPLRKAGRLSASVPPCGEGMGMGGERLGARLLVEVDRPTFRRIRSDFTPPTPSPPHKGEGLRLRLSVKHQSNDR